MQPIKDRQQCQSCRGFNIHNLHVMNKIYTIEYDKRTFKKYEGGIINFLGNRKVFPINDFWYISPGIGCRGESSQTSCFIQCPAHSIFFVFICTIHLFDAQHNREFNHGIYYKQQGNQNIGS